MFGLHYFSFVEADIMFVFSFADWCNSVVFITMSYCLKSIILFTVGCTEFMVKRLDVHC